MRGKLSDLGGLLVFLSPQNLMDLEFNLNQPVWPKSYVPSPRIPEWFAEGLARLGHNTYGQPNYRVVWGMDARGFRNGNPRAMKFANFNDPELGWACFLLERWATPEFFNRSQWIDHRYAKAEDGKTIDVLGPFPKRGDYIVVGQLMTHAEPLTPLELSQQLLDELLERLSPGKMKSPTLGMLEIEERIRKSENEAKVRRLLDEQFEYYRMNKDRKNREAGRSYVGLLSDLPAAAHERTSSLISL